MERSPRRGSMLVLVALSLTGLLGLTGLAVDAGYMRLASSRVQSATDAAALAALSALPDVDEAEVRAQAVLDHYALGAHTFTLQSEDLEVGTWDTDAAAFDASGDGSGRAVRLTARLEGLPSFFAQFVGIDSFSVSRTAVVAKGGSAGPCGILADTLLEINGAAVIDSYDGSQGPYASFAANENGDVCSNGALHLNGGVEVYGDAWYYDELDENGGPTVTGEVDELPEPIDLPVVDSSDAQSSNDNGSLPSGTLTGTKLKLSGRDAVTLSAGVYYFSEIKVSGQAEITIDGDVEIYCDGTVSFTGTSFTNTGEDALDLTLYVEGAQSVKIAGAGLFTGQIIAPGSELSFTGGAGVSGRVIGDHIKIAGTPDFHFDESTVDEDTTSTTSFVVVR